MFSPVRAPFRQIPAQGRTALAPVQGLADTGCGRVMLHAPCPVAHSRAAFPTLRPGPFRAGPQVSVAVRAQARDADPAGRRFSPQGAFAIRAKRL